MNDIDMNSGNWMFKFVPAFIGFVFVMIIVSWIVYAVLFVKGYQYIEKNGLKGVVTVVWNVNGNGTNNIPTK